MDIQINAAQGRGKTTLARAIANTQGGIIYDVENFTGSEINLTRIAQDIVSARADVAIFDGAPDWAVQRLKSAVQSARQTLRRNIVAIYCVQDGTVGVASTSQAFIPFGFVNAADAFARMDERPRNTFKDNGRKPAGVWVDEAVHGFRDNPIVDGITEQSIGGMAAKSYAADELLAMARLIHAHGSNPASMASVYEHFGVDNLADLPPIFHATARVLMLPIWQAAVSNLRNKCRDIVKSHMTGAAVPKSLRTLVQKYGISVADVDAIHLPELYEKLQQYGK